MAALRPPVAVVEAKPVPEIPTSRTGRWAYEPKFDGWRCLLFTVDGYLQSRRETDLTGRFPEISAAAAALGDVVLDGELVALKDGRLDFGALTSTPRGRAEAGITIYFVAFDLLADGRTDLRPKPYRDRRKRLEKLFAVVTPPLQLAPSTTDQSVALTWMDPGASQVGIEGCVGKQLGSPYRAGRSGSWVKIRQMVVVDAVVVGVTGTPDCPDELVLARPDSTGQLRKIGLSQPITPEIASEVAGQVRLTGEPPQKVSSGVFGRGQTQFRPVIPDVVVEVRVEATIATFTNRLRPKVHRVRPDLTVHDLQV
ncbi:hypothetical protein [Amycolatopsis sp. lyj-108]|uniref:ATP-dependent DNA ligase n=1 Tax=Amycolatopsis sp. lyj-108 TaxID=2789286 RepID=UPI0039788504